MLAIGVVTVSVAAIVAVSVSYSHEIDLAMRAGQGNPGVGEGKSTPSPNWRSATLPVTVLGLLVASSIVLLIRRLADEPTDVLFTGGHLRESDRTLAVIWTRRALSKLQSEDSRAQAIGMLTTATTAFERLDEPNYWVFGQQDSPWPIEARASSRRLSTTSTRPSATAWLVHRCSRSVCSPRTHISSRAMPALVRKGRRPSRTLTQSQLS